MAGGLGTRMSRFTKELPKALIPVSGQPFIRHQLQNLNRQGISQVLISTGYLGEQIEAEVAAHCPTGMSVTCVSDGPTLLGTGGSLRRLFDLSYLDDIFMLTYGDSYLTIDHEVVRNTFKADSFDALMTICDNHDGHEAGNAIVEDGRVSLYKKGQKDSRMKWIDYGLSILHSSLLAKMVEPNIPSDIAIVFETISQQGRLQAYTSTDRYFEIGSETGLVEFEKYLADHQS